MDTKEVKKVFEDFITNYLQKEIFLSSSNEIRFIYDENHDKVNKLSEEEQSEIVSEIIDEFMKYRIDKGLIEENIVYTISVHATDEYITISVGF